ncbi:hypothetical protein [Chryseobacterium sp.]|uniref:hypothetical protein n=1 Tax=Chryseobacterium sp. TaxID=1871047 RepID=UPI001B10E8EE|nr:hypothetical protein [Chryseobacterium sp.]MBO9694246.1 hypothetical protein [Chryseobacterium sp.]
MNLTGRIIITFNDIFPDEKPKTINEYLDGIDKDLLLKFGTFLLGFSQNSKYENPLEFLKMYFSQENQEFFHKVLSGLDQFIKQTKWEIDSYSFPYVASSLSFFENAFDKEYGITKNYTHQEIEIRVFKAYLLFNKCHTTERTLILNNSLEYLKEDASKYATAYCLGLFLNNSDLVNYDVKKVFTTQVLRAISFFEFLESRNDTKELLKEFYKEYDISNYQEYIKRLLPIQIAVLKKEKEAHTDINITQNEGKESSISFLNKFSIKESELLKDFDFRNIRSTPMYRFDENTFRLISPLFVLELIGNGLYFKFKHINDRLPKEKKVKDLYGLKTYDFSEKYILHKILKEYFGNRYFQKNGDELDAQYDGAPDYYVRNGKKIFLFESKDILINAIAKQSSDFREIEKELFIKLYKNEDGKPKAVLQFINNIRKILSKKLEFDSNYNPKNIILYPVLVLHYRIFNTAGLNKWINFWFQEELDKLEKEGFNISNIKPLILIDIDTLIFHKEVFAGRKLSLEEVLNEYGNDFINFTVKGKKYRSEEDVIQASKNLFLPFGYYLDNKIDLKKLREVSKELMEKTYGLFDK